MPRAAHRAASAVPPIKPLAGGALIQNGPNAPAGTSRLDVHFLAAEGHVGVQATAGPPCFVLPPAGVPAELLAPAARIPAAMVIVKP